ncbi:MAG: aminotransferase class V-fold PLP-dependent enzyme [Chloroflexota bacterium]|nr:aminotransferase class V-fold PLP-dependent enzyme [Chloroflexota bacterium]
MAEVPQRGAIYRRLGVEPIINGRSTFTILGGSLMPAEVLDAMRLAADSFVDLVELQVAVGRRLAELARNEAAFVSAGAAAGLFLAAATCIARDTADGVLRLDDLDGDRRRFLIHAAHRIPYERAIELAGGSLVEIGGPDRTEESQLQAALEPPTAAVLYVPKPHLAARVLPLDTVVRLAHARDVPVIVDAAAQLPPVENLWLFTGAGADLAIFSGGKGLSGPASTGLVVGRARYVDRLAANAAPLQRYGRPMKVGKEDLVGLLAAVEWYLAQDHEALARRYEAVVDHLVVWGRERNDVTVTRVGFGEAGQPTPRAHVRLDGATTGARDDLLATLRARPPRIDLLADESDGFFVAPETLLPGEEEIISRRLGELLDPAVNQPRRSG